MSTTFEVLAPLVRTSVRATVETAGRRLAHPSITSYVSAVEAARPAVNAAALLGHFCG